MDNLMTLLPHLDDLASLNVTARLYEDQGVYHFVTGCPEYHGDSWQGYDTHLLQAIQAGATCPECWQWIEPGNPGAPTVHTILAGYRSERDLNEIDASTHPVMTFLAAANAVSETERPAHASGRSWYQDIHKRAFATYQTSQEAATTKACKEEALRLAEELTNSWVESSEEGCFLVLNNPHLNERDLVADLSVPYHLVTRGWEHLVWAPPIVAEAIVSQCRLRSEWDFDAPIPVASSSDIVERVTEMWIPEDPLLGNLPKLVEAARLIR